MAWRFPRGVVVTRLFGLERLLGEGRRRTATLVPDWLSVST
jgi:hypothetical protein